METKLTSRPTYYTEYDEVDKVWRVSVTENPYVFIAEFTDSVTAISVCDCMNDLMTRLWDRDKDGSGN